MAKEKGVLTLHQRAVLDVIAREKYFTERYYLAGGTALAEFHLGHRLSEDLDFFIEHSEVTPSPILTFFKSNARALGIARWETKLVMGLHTFFLHFDDGEVLKVDFNYYPFPLIEQGMRYHGLQIESAYDIGVDKVHTIAMKARARDFIDVYFIVRERGYIVHDLLMQAKAKFDWDISPMDLGTRFLEAAEARDYPRMLKPIDHQEWKDFFVEEARKLKKEIFKP